MKIRIAVNGASGKMGKMATSAIAEHENLELVLALSSHDNLKEALSTTKVDVVVDLTRADVVFQNSLTIIESNVRPVIGTSGLTKEEIGILSARCREQQLGALVIPNFSIGAVLMMQFAAMAAPYFSNVEIVEAHHDQKYDAPSQTALKTAEMMHSAKGEDFLSPPSHESVANVRGGKLHGASIHSLRLPGVVARQEIFFGEQGERLTVAHESIDRIAYQKGLLLSIERVMRCDHLIEGLENILFKNA